MKVLLLGANGQLGHCFQDVVPKDWDVRITDSADLDITNEQLVFDVVNAYQPDFIVNAAAYTAVDKAEKDIKLAYLVNSTGPANLAKAARATGASFVHVSTDYVFDGTASVPYMETDTTNPLGVYGKSKREGELAVHDILPEAIIIRTAWVFSEYGNNFLKTMLRLGKDRDSLSIVADQFGCPTYAGDIARAIVVFIQKKTPGGIYHFCGDKAVSWYEFAQFILNEAFDKRLLNAVPSLNPITTKEYPTPAVRPAYSVLDTKKIETLDIRASDWQSAVVYVLGKL